MRYMMMVYSSEAALARMTGEEMMRVVEEFDAFHEDVGKRGALQMAERLHPTSTATTVRLRDGKTLATDGPFAETKEQLGGVYVFECEDLDEAIEIAARIPTAKGGSVEIRPVLDAPEGM